VVQLGKLLGRAVEMALALSSKLRSEKTSGIRDAMLGASLTTDFPVRHLSLKAIAWLFERLEQNASLGRLNDFEPNARVSAFEKDESRQLLVALHRLTSGSRLSASFLTNISELFLKKLNCFTLTFLP
jgi:hypothetical protein